MREVIKRGGSVSISVGREALPEGGISAKALSLSKSEPRSEWRGEQSYVRLRLWQHGAAWRAASVV